MTTLGVFVALWRALNVVLSVIAAGMLTLLISLVEEAGVRVYLAQGMKAFRWIVISSIVGSAWLGITRADPQPGMFIYTFGVGYLTVVLIRVHDYLSDQREAEKR